MADVHEVTETTAELTVGKELIKTCKVLMKTGWIKSVLRVSVTFASWNLNTSMKGDMMPTEGSHIRIVAERKLLYLSHIYANLNTHTVADAMNI